MIFHNYERKQPVTLLRWLFVALFTDWDAVRRNEFGL